MIYSYARALNVQFMTEMKETAFILQNISERYTRITIRVGGSLILFIYVTYII